MVDILAVQTFEEESQRTRLNAHGRSKKNDFTFYFSVASLYDCHTKVRFFKKCTFSLITLGTIKKKKKMF